MTTINATTTRLKYLLGEGLRNRKTLLLTLDSPFLDNAYVFPYLGILHLLAVARSNGMPVKFMQFSVYAQKIPISRDPYIGYADCIGPDNVNSCIIDFDVIGISCMTPQGQQAYHLCEQIKRLFPSKTVILGGPHAHFYIKVKAFFMAGLPGETERTFALTHDFIKFYRKKFPSHFDFDLSIFFPYRGTMIGDAIRLNDGESIQVPGRRLDRSSFDVRLNPEYTWDLIDSGNMGAYKKKGGSSDLVIESYDWQADRLLLSAQRIKALKDLTMKYSGRYARVQNHNNLAGQTVSEGNIGHAVNLSMRKSAERLFMIAR